MDRWKIHLIETVQGLDPVQTLVSIVTPARRISKGKGEDPMKIVKECHHCGSEKLYMVEKNGRVGLRCEDCNGWIKWLNKAEIDYFTHKKESELEKEKVTPADLSINNAKIDEDAAFEGALSGIPMAVMNINSAIILLNDALADLMELIEGEKK